MRKIATATLLLLPVLVALWGAPVSADGPSPGVPTRLAGTVIDANDSPLVGVSVKLFDEGLLITSTTTDENGGYEIDLVIDRRDDTTILVWWVAPRTDLVSEVALLRESRRDRDLDLWGPCVPRIQTPRQEPWEVRIRDRGAVLEDQIRSGCSTERRVRPGSGKWYDQSVRG